MSADTTFNALKYKRYASAGIKVDDEWVTSGSTYWVNDSGQLHREDGPAAEWPDGAKEWFYHGKRHREDGPAGEYSNGSKYWHWNGKLHREDGPAIEYSNGSAEWYLNGKFIRSKWRHHIQCSEV